MAFSERPMERRRKQLLEEIKDADLERGKGVMGSLARGSVLLQLEKVYTGESRRERAE